MKEEQETTTHDKLVSGGEASISTDKSLGEQLQGKYLTFQLANEQYGVHILKVQEIITMQKITCIPKVPPHVRGVINLRGKVIPVVDLRARFGMERVEDTEKTVIIVLYVDNAGTTLTMGVCVDEVKEVIDMAAGNIEKAPSMGTLNTDFIMGIGKAGEEIDMLLDMDKILVSET